MLHVFPHETDFKEVFYMNDNVPQRALIGIIESLIPLNLRT
jgi:hypothetical protein